ncbi:hypothetical protein [Acidimangrovimonas sediminis]|uniref:hypothetical protein n=1 Tax=Acidimangrovimonas sediminis TaxID=2056283 RepID=UPI000C805492|nr:hypothetical protein [Acidimangrovimonas sediminis]
MAHLVLHIGLHKTATTTIQDTLFQNRELLLNHGLIYPFVGETRGHHGLVTRWIPMPAPYALRGNPEAEWHRVAADYADADGTVFLSSEEFSRAHPRQVDLDDLRRLTEPYESVQVICMLRNQRSFLQSVYGQIARDRAAPEVRGFVRHALDTGFADGLWMDYDALSAHLETVFAPDELTFLSYEAATASEGGIMGEMLRRLHVPVRADQLKPFAKGRSNVSHDPLAALVAGAISRPGIAPAALVGLVEQVLRDQFGPDMRGTIFSPEESSDIAQRFTASNARFLARRASVQPGLTLADPVVSGNEIGRDRLTRPVWERIARALWHAGEAA